MSFAPTLKRCAIQTGIKAVPASATADMAKELLPPIALYRRLLRVHRRVLPTELRVFGDEYVKVSSRIVLCPLILNEILIVETEHRHPSFPSSRSTLRISGRVQENEVDRQPIAYRWVPVRVEEIPRRARGAIASIIVPFFFFFFDDRARSNPRPFNLGSCEYRPLFFR